MQYDMQKLGRMTLEQLKEIAASFGLKVGRNASLQSIIYDILDAQADKRGAEVQAKEDAKQAKNEEKKRGKRQRIQNTPTKVNTDNLKSNRMIATVGNEQETLGQIKEEQAKQPTPKPVVSAQQANIFSLEDAALQDGSKTDYSMEAKGVVSDQGDKAKGEEVKAKKKRGRPKKSAEASNGNAEKQEAKGVVSDQGDKAKGEENPNTPKKSAETPEEKKARLDARIAQITKQIAKREEQLANGEEVTPIQNQPNNKPEEELLEKGAEAFGNTIVAVGTL